MSTPPTHDATGHRSTDDDPSTSSSRQDSLEATHRMPGPLTTGRNVFGLFRRYWAENLPSHDLESEVTASMLSNIVDPGSADLDGAKVSKSSFRPYPNENSFLLGEWYWNSGTQKSQQSFKGLLNIVGNATFNPADIREANWDKINETLAVNDRDRDTQREADAGWIKTPIKIQVPFHRFTDNPGIQEYAVADFHYHSLVSIIREKVQNAADSQHFHYDPYEVFWQPTKWHEEVRIHGELFTSPAFIDAHKELQDSPGEPKCNLPRVAITLMFWSDATHLTNFGDAKLWPLYMFFGNESKYRRCKPSCNLCEHVAYFEKVYFLPFSYAVSDVQSFGQLPDAFKDFRTSHAGKKLNREFFTHCH